MIDLQENVAMDFFAFNIKKIQGLLYQHSFESADYLALYALKYTQMGSPSIENNLTEKLTFNSFT